MSEDEIDRNLIDTSQRAIHRRGRLALITAMNLRTKKVVVKAKQRIRPPLPRNHYTQMIRKSAKDEHGCARVQLK